ncbi:hypothetical protein FH508_0008720 [Lysinibacillus sp. CD3-6]|uniref:hypothetical protein n=1 Tax=Lysinibacillus sp. CD3-6 TaxID=2892541 RepID=UPI001121CA49|nr:hypothetical protein [Lysinibacillus sp. CD3-6]UED81962.1 hypothetical protein FH508_0008720 [Lysinibacillus sp. CD3-6]
MKKKVIEWFIKLGWPVVKYVIMEFGQEILSFAFESLKQKARNRSKEKMEEALRNAENAEKAAESTEDPKEKLKYYDIANNYRKIAEYQGKFLSDMLDVVESTSKEIMDSVQQKTSKIKAEDLFVLDRKEGKLKAVENQKLLEHDPTSN